MKTPVSKNFIILIFIILFVGLGIVFFIHSQSSINPAIDPSDEVLSPDAGTFITEIGEQIIIDEKNIKGSYPQIIGESQIAVLAREQISNFVADITRQANEQLPELRQDFPEAYAERNYEVEVQANHYTSENTESLVALEYMYTGGANGTSFYVTFNQNNQGEVITLSDIIPAKKRVAFVRLVQDRLRNYNGNNGQGLELFAEAVQGLTFNQLDRFAVEDNTLHIYFDKYEVGAGASGSIVISIDDYPSIVDDLDTTDPKHPSLSWSYESVPNEDYPKSIVSLAIDDGSEFPSMYTVETIDGSCNTVDQSSYSDEGEKVSLAGDSSPILCYFAGFGRIFRVIEEENSYVVQGKDIEEGSPEYTPPETRFETIINIPKK